MENKIENKKENPTFVKVREILRNYKGEPELQVTMDSKFFDLQFDSLDIVDLVMEMEKEMKVTIEMSKEIETVGHLVTIIDKKLKGE